MVNNYNNFILIITGGIYFLLNQKMNKNTNITLFSILTLLILSIFSAYFIEYGLGHKPCKLCLYQRYPYFISIFLILNILIIKKYIKTFFANSCFSIFAWINHCFLPFWY